MPHLVMLRHGQSQWNLENRFTGWTDVDLTGQGINEARHGGRLIADAGVEIDLCHTSVLKRAIRTLWLALEEMDRMWLPQTPSWRLNERHYGALQGLNKSETAEKHGADQVKLWRRSYDTPPPALEPDDPRHPRNDPRYKDLQPDELPGTESLKLTLERVMPYWDASIAPDLEAGANILIGAHGNSLRALVKHLLNLSDEEVIGLEIPTGNPLLFDLTDDLAVKSVRYLDEARAVEIPGL